MINLENETYWVTYLNPFRIIKHTNESIKFSLDEINYVTYDSSILCRMIGTIVSIFQGAKVEYIICGDGAIAISRKNTSFTSNLFSKIIGHIVHRLNKKYYIKQGLFPKKFIPTFTLCVRQEIS